MVEPFRKPVSLTVVAGTTSRGSHETCVIEIKNGSKVFNQAIPYAVLDKTLTATIAYIPDEGVLQMRLECGWGWYNKDLKLDYSDPELLVHLPQEMIDSVLVSAQLMIDETASSDQRHISEKITELVNNGFAIELDRKNPERSTITSNPFVENLVVLAGVQLGAEIAGVGHPAFNLGCDGDRGKVLTGRIIVPPGSAVALDPTVIGPDVDERVQKDSQVKIGAWKFEGTISRNTC